VGCRGAAGTAVPTARTHVLPPYDPTNTPPPPAANDLLNDAETAEDELSRQQTAETDVLFGKECSFDLSSESLALVRVSARPAELGNITAMNTAAAALFGYHKREAIGRDVSTLIPEVRSRRTAAAQCEQRWACRWLRSARAGAHPHQNHPSILSNRLPARAAHRVSAQRHAAALRADRRGGGGA
jgi:PAS domain-containing protein